MSMKLSFRWYGPEDPVPLWKIRQIPNMRVIVAAVYDVPPGEIWSRESIGALKAGVEENGMRFEVVESVPVHEDIKLGLPTRDKYIEAYCENIRRLAQAGVKCICYNFMPVFDWTRTDLATKLPDGSNALTYDKSKLASMDPLTGELSLPGWDASYRKEDLRRLFHQYESVDEAKLWDNLRYFLEAVIPVAAESDVFMAIHPDDPPHPIFGLPRIITCEANIDRMLGLVDDEHNGLTLCTGSYGCARGNDVVHMARKYAAKGRIHFVHLRNVLLTEKGFEESAHYSACGSLDMPAIVKALIDEGFGGYVRPDHGRMIWGETGRPGYGLYDRALGASYITGLWEAIERYGDVGLE